MIDWSKVEQACRDYLEWIESEEYVEDDIDDYENEVVEAAMFAVFGPDVYETRINPAMER